MPPLGLKSLDPGRREGRFISIVILVVYSDRLVDRANDIEDTSDATPPFVTVWSHSRVWTRLEKQARLKPYSDAALDTMGVGHTK